MRLPPVAHLRTVNYPGAVLCLWLAFAAPLAPEAPAMPASPHAFEGTQPDGRRAELHVRGDEFFHWLEDRRGFTVVQDGEWFVYGRRDAASGRVVSTGLRAGHDDPAAAGLPLRVLPDTAVRNARREAMRPGGAAHFADFVTGSRRRPASPGTGRPSSGSARNPN